jgi:hypothetical protein
LSVTYTDYITALKSNIRQPIVKLEFLDNNENVTSEITPDLISGDLQLSSDIGSRRNLNLVLENIDGAYTPVEEGSLWINSKVRIFTGLRVNDEDYYISRGIFVIGDPEISSNFSEQTASLSFMDKWSLLNGELAGELEDDYVISVGTNIETAVRAIFTAAGEVKSPIIAPVTTATPTTVYTITEEAGSNFAEILIKLAKMLGSWTVFYDRNGFPRFQPSTDIDDAPSVWDFTTNEVTYRGNSRQFEFSKIKNSVKIIGDNISGNIATGLAQDTSVTSPTRISLIGTRSVVITDELIYNDILAQERADWELVNNYISLAESIDITALPIDIIEGDHIITITDSGNGLIGDRYLVKSGSFPLTNGQDMKLSVWKTRSLS